MERYLTEAFDFLTPNGAVYLGYSSTHAEWNAAQLLAARLGLRFEEIAAMSSPRIRIELLKVVHAKS